MQEVSKIDQEVLANLAMFTANPYPGRGFVIGRDTTGENIVQVYWLMGRSENSRNRKFVRDGNVVRTEPVDPSKVTDSSLIIYDAMRDAMREHSNYYAVTNGDQTDTIFEAMIRGGPDFFTRAMRQREHEPDEPNFTPRISAMCSLYRSRQSLKIAVLSKSVFEGCDRTFYEYNNVPKGYGYCVHTYRGDGNPLSAFLERPYLLPLAGKTIGGISKFYWDTLNEKNRVALVTKFVNVESGESKVKIINRF